MINSSARRRGLPRLLPCCLLLALAVPLVAEEVTVDFGDAILETWVQPRYPELRKAKPDDGTVASVVVGPAGEVTQKQVVAGAEQEGYVVVEFVVEADGTVTRERVAESCAEVFNQPALDAVRQWRFKPALEDGKPAATGLSAPEVFSPRQLKQKQAPMMPEQRHLPRPLKIEPARAEGGIDPDYPTELDALRLPGLVRIRFTVDPTGVARQPQVLFASHPAFVETALRTLEQKKFVPAHQGPLARSDKMEYPVSFQSFGAKPVDVLAANHLEQVDPALGAPLPVMLVQPVYPRERLLAGESATVAAEFTVNADGMTEDIQITDPTGGDFEEALRAAIESWVFQAVRGDEGTIAVRLRVRHEFAPALAEERLAVHLKPDGGGIKGPSGLDQPLKPLWRGFPVYPRKLLDERLQGRAVIEFVIDRDGRARVPRVVEATAPEFGWAGMAAITQWVFERPMRGGQPVDVTVRVPVEFQPPRT
jgi:TonB family protein